MDIVAYLRIVRRHWKIIVAAMLVGALIGAGSAVLQDSNDSGSPDAPTFYKATHTLFLDTSSIGSQARPAYTNLDQIAVLVTTGEVPRQVASELGGEATDWSSRIFTVTNGTTSTLDIICAERTASEAATCADTFAKDLLASLNEREQSRFNSLLDDTVQRQQTLAQQIADLDAQIAARPPDVALLQARRDSTVNQYRIAFERFQGLADQGGPAEVLSTLENAEAQPISAAEYANRLEQGRLGQNRIRGDLAQSGEPVATTNDSGSDRFSGPVSRGILGALLGIMLGLGIAIGLDRLDRRLRTREEVEAAFGMPVLAEVPVLTPAQRRSQGILSASAPLSRTAEAYRAARSSLMFQRSTEAREADGDALVVMVGSAGPKEGKTTTSANLAAVFAETGARVLAINCDFRRPTLHTYFDLANEPRRVFETTIPGVWTITDVTAGPSSTNPALVVEEQRRLVASARSRFDVIVLDTAPLLTTNDATEVMPSVDLVVLTCRSGTTTADSAQRTRELLARIAAPTSGVILLGSEASSNDYYYYYSRSQAKQTANGDDGEVAERLFDDDDDDEKLFGPDAMAPAPPDTSASDPRPAP